MNFEIIADSVQLNLKRCRGESIGLMELSFDCDQDDITAHLSPRDILRVIDAEELLKEIGRDAAIDYWNITEAE